MARSRQALATPHQWYVSRESAAPLFVQIYEQLKAAILSRRLRAGAKLPATRELARELALKIEVLRDLEEPVRELMENHERKRELWFPSDFLSAQPENCPDDFVRRLRNQASSIPDPIRAALALNMLTEEGLPHFHRLLAVYLGDESHWRAWNNLWTAEEDRHGGAVFREAEVADDREALIALRGLESGDEVLDVLGARGRRGG